MSWKKKVALGFATLLAVLLLFFVVEHVRGRWGLSRWKSRMAARGEPLTILAAMPPAGSTDEDGMPALMAASGRASYLEAKLRPPAAMYIDPGKVVVITRMCQWPVNGRPKTNITWEVVGEVIQKQQSALADALAALKHQRFYGRLNYYAGWSLL